VESELCTVVQVKKDALPAPTEQRVSVFARRQLFESYLMEGPRGECVEMTQTRE